MGCQNSRLNLLDVANSQPQPDNKGKQAKVCPYREVLSECKENMPSANAKPANKGNQALSIRILPADDAGKQTSHRKNGKELVKKTVDLIQQLQYTSKVGRLQKFTEMRTEEQYCSYFDDIRQSLKKKEETMKQVVTEVEKCGCKKSNIQPNEIIQFIQGYLNEQKASLSETKGWLKEKISYVKKEGLVLAKWLKTASSKWNDTKSLPEILSIAIEDHVSSSHPFFLSLAYNYQFQNLIDQKSEWQSLLLPIYSQLCE